MSSYHKEECARIWRTLGCPEDSGKVGVEVILRHARYLERSFPELLEKYSKVAVKGSVTWEAFQGLYLGVPVTAAPTGGAGVNAKGISGSSEEVDQVFRRRKPTADLRKLFEAIDADGSGTISLADAVREQELVLAELPEILGKWMEIDTDENGSISWDEFRAFYGDVDDWLEFQLGEVVGLEDLKAQIRKFYRGVMLDQARRQRGHKVGAEQSKCHMIFQGNPGTGKTSMARLMARLLHRVGILPTDRLTEVQQDQLVAGYVGQTAAKTQKVIEEATGGVLFIDEAYRLSQGKNEFGKEAIEQLMAAMNEPPQKAPVMIFAGYPADMRNFMAQNDGLYRRIPYTFDFPNYTCSEIAEILDTMVAKAGFALEHRLLANGRQRLARLVETETLPRVRALMNGGLCERIFAFAKQALDARDDPEHPSVELVEEDVSVACKRIPPPPESQSGSDGQRAGDPELVAQVKRLQDEVTKLHREKAQLQRELAQGSTPQLLQATLNPGAGSATVLGGTQMAELQGVTAILKELRKVKAELQGRDQEVEHLRAEVHWRDERVRQLEAENKGLKERLQSAQVVGAGAGFPAGTRVQYLSGSVNKWLDAVVQSYDAAAGTYDLDIKKGAPADRVRAATEAGQQPSSGQAPPPQAAGDGKPPGSYKLVIPAFGGANDGGAGRGGQPDGGGGKALDEAAASQVAAQFRRFDRNGDGVLDKEELGRLLRSLDPTAWPDERIGRLCTAVDTSKDGRIQYQEFVDWVFRIGYAYKVGRSDDRVQLGELARLSPEEKALWSQLRRAPRDQRTDA